MPKILVVDDEPDALEVLGFNLKNAGYEVTTADDGDAALKKARQQLPDLILLDLMLPEVDGLEVCKLLRRDPATSAIPIIMVTAKAGEIDRVVGLELGADDYVTKPFSPRELLARAKALLRRKSPEHAQSTMRAGNVMLDPVSCTVSMDQQKIDIGHAEYKLLKFLLAHPERVFSRSQLLDKVWGDHVVIEERTVDVHVLRLRKVLKNAEGLIKTVRSVGYMLSEK